MTALVQSVFSFGIVIVGQPIEDVEGIDVSIGIFFVQDSREKEFYRRISKHMPFSGIPSVFLTDLVSASSRV